MSASVDDQHSAWGFLVVLVLVVLAAPILQVTYAEATATVDVADEPHTVNYTDPVEVSESGVAYGDTATVTVETDNNTTRTLQPGTDYDWDATNGTVAFNSTGDTTSGQQASVSYSYETRAAATDAVWTIMQTVLGLLGVYVLVAALNAIRAYLGLFETAAAEGDRA
jgi:Ca2+/Na+ antiporter